jgi:xanthine dehydrogenase YagR molybdenum-binding subunit
VQTSSQEIGTGVRTVSAQMAAERLNVDISAVTVEAGDTNLPPAPVAGGSNSTASICSAVLTACDRIRARRDARPNEEVIEEYVEWSPNGPEGIQKLYKGQMAMKSGGGPDKMMYSFGAEFVEVRINRFTREIRCPRVVGAFAAGRIMNTRTARSQLMGGMIWGIGSALHEATEIDKRTARYVNRDLAEYLVPVNADVAQVDVILMSEEDHEVNPAGVKGLGELGNVGTAAAIANAVYHATGMRIRDLPIRIDNLIA